MKTMVMLLALAFCASAFASGPVTPKKWVCDGEGFDQRTMDYRTFPGFAMPTLEKARDSAISNCTAMRLMGCIAKNCRQTAGVIRAVNLSARSNRWFCTAEGFDSDMRRRSVSGNTKTTEKLAREDALKICNQLWMGCSVKSCFGL